MGKAGKAWGSGSLPPRLPPRSLSALGALGRRWVLLLLLGALLLLLCLLDPGTVRLRLGHGPGGHGLGHGLHAQHPATPATRAAARPTGEPAGGHGHGGGVDGADGPGGAWPESSITSGFLVDTPGCRIPFLAPLDEAVRPFVFPVRRVHCEDAGPALVEVDPRRDVLRLRRDRAHAYNVSDPQQLACCARAFWRPLPPPPPAPLSGPSTTANPPAPTPTFDYRGIDDTVEFAENCTDFPVGDALVVTDEFVRVECMDGDLPVYRDVFGFTPPKPPRPAQPPPPHSNDNNKNNNDDNSDNVIVEDVVDPDTPRVSVLIVGADSVSRSNLLRQMPRTLQLLRDIEAIDMMGYNKVEDNTFPNLVAVLAGLSVEELRQRCWPTASTPFDDCPFIWKRFEALGYRTAYAEDEPWMGIFNYIKNGFVNPPVHYYMRPYARVLLKELGTHLEYNCHLCTGPRFQLQALLDYATRFARLGRPAAAASASASGAEPAEAEDADPAAGAAAAGPAGPEGHGASLFGLFWGVSLTHDQLNSPQLADPLYARWLRTARDEGVLNRSVVVFLSDHGMRWGDIRETYQGRLEERLPFLMIALPRWLRERYPSAAANLRRNSRRLVTPYDLHATLEDLLDLSRLEQSAIRERSELLGRLRQGLRRPPRAVSMFLVAPDSRSCEDAGIEPHWCTCYSSRAVSAGDAVARRAALFVVRRVNGMLSGFRQCARLALDALLDARLQEGRPELDGREGHANDSGRPAAAAGNTSVTSSMTSSSRSKDAARVADYALLLRVQPGGALFEATVRVRSVAVPVRALGKDSKDPHGKQQQQQLPPRRRELLELAGTVSRVNRYGSQSSCVADYHMKLYCFCGK